MMARRFTMVVGGPLLVGALQAVLAVAGAEAELALGPHPGDLPDVAEALPAVAEGVHAVAGDAAIRHRCSRRRP